MTSPFRRAVDGSLVAAAAAAVLLTCLLATAATESGKPDDKPQNPLDQSRSPDEFLPGEDSPADVYRKIDKWMSASDAGNRVAFSHFKDYLRDIYNWAKIESRSTEVDKVATPLIPDIDRLVSERATKGSPTAQYWMAHRQTDYMFGRVEAWQDPEVVKWYRRSAEQGFAPAQSELGFLLDTFGGPA